MRNEYLKNLNKIEFAVTYACSGRCRHCSVGEDKTSGECINPSIAADAVKRICSEYGIETLMCFGGEPLLRIEAVEKIIGAGTDIGIPRRQVITNGYFSANAAKIRDAARRLSLCGVNDLLLSVDAFHQETIPLDTVKKFATEALGADIPIRLQPAWLVSTDDNNPYNLKTREVLESFSDLDIPIGEGNVVFPEGNAIKYLGEYFTDSRPENPYIEDPKNLRCLSFSPLGDVAGGNIYRSDIMDILKNYKP